MKITEAQKGQVQSAISMPGYLNQQYGNWCKGEQTNAFFKFQQNMENATYTARSGDGDFYEVRNIDSKYLLSARLRNEDGSHTTIKLVDEGKCGKERYECDFDEDGVIDYIFRASQDEDYHTVSYEEDANCDGKYELSWGAQYESGVLVGSQITRRDETTGHWMYTSDTEYFEADSSFHQSCKETNHYYDVNGNPDYTTIKTFDSQGRILEEIYDDHHDREYLFGLFRKSDDYRVEYCYIEGIAKYYDSTGKLYKTEDIEYPTEDAINA